MMSVSEGVDVSNAELAVSAVILLGLMVWCSDVCSSDLYFFFNDQATTEIYTLSLHDALPI